VTHKIVSEITYNVSSWTSNPAIPIPENFSTIILVRTIWRTYSLFRSPQDTDAVAFQTKPVYYPYLRHLILMTSCRTETETVSRMEKAEPLDCCSGHQSVASPSLCLCQGSQWTFFLSSFFPCGAGSISSSCLVLWPPNGPNARPQHNIHLT